MSAHDHTTHVDGCFRCELSRDEAESAMGREIADLEAELDAAHQHLAEGATMMESLLADREQLAGVVESIASRRCLCEAPHGSHGGPCCGVAGGKCVTCEARAGLGSA